jgi:hypothetical protein
MLRRTMLMVLILLAGPACWVPPAQAQRCQYSPHWGQQGESWDPHGPLKDFSYAGYHRGDDPIPYQQRPAALTFGPGVHTITERIVLTAGVLRGAGVHETTLYFPHGLIGMGYPCPRDTGGNCWDWGGGVIQLGPGREIGLEDVTIAFPPHPYRHHRGKGFNGPDLRGCEHCWVKHVRVINTDEGFGIHGGHHNSLEDVEVIANPRGAHNYIHMTLTQDNLVNRFSVSARAIHGLSGNWGTRGGVYANGTGDPVRIEPDHNGPTTTGLLYSNIHGTGGHKVKLSDTVLWNYMTHQWCPEDLYTAQLKKRRGALP